MLLPSPSCPYPPLPQHLTPPPLVSAQVCTPPAVIARLYRETSALMEQNALRERFTAAGLEPLGGTPEAFAQRVRLELPKWREVVRTANIRAD